MKSNTTKTVQLRPDYYNGVYVIPCGEGYSCLGFDVCMKRASSLAAELGQPAPSADMRGTMAAYQAYQDLVNMAASRNRTTGWKSSSELTPQLIGLEGKKVEVVDCYGEKRRFKVGRSTGWIPCHLEIPIRVERRQFTKATWKSEVADNVTTLGFEDWVEEQVFLETSGGPVIMGSPFASVRVIGGAA